MTCQDHGLARSAGGNDPVWKHPPPRVSIGFHNHCLAPVLKSRARERNNEMDVKWIGFGFGYRWAVAGTLGNSS